jgi:hypothetical protein
MMARAFGPMGLVADGLEPLRKGPVRDASPSRELAVVHLRGRSMPRLSWAGRGVEVATEDPPGRDHEEAEPDIDRRAADLLDRMRQQLDRPNRRDIAEKWADWRLRRAAELLRQQATTEGDNTG